MIEEEQLREITNKLIETVGIENVASPEHEPLVFNHQWKMAKRMVDLSMKERTIVIDTEDQTLNIENMG